MIKIISLFVGVLLLSGCATNTVNTSKNVNNNFELSELVKAEPKVKDFVITDANFLYVAVEDD